MTSDSYETIKALADVAIDANQQLNDDDDLPKSVAKISLEEIEEEVLILFLCCRPPSHLDLTVKHKTQTSPRMLPVLTSTRTTGIPSARVALTIKKLPRTIRSGEEGEDYGT
eukprot:761286-Hanusia_phi.AAC.8